MDDQDGTLEIVALIYDAAVDPALWPEAIRRLSARLNSSVATLLLGDATLAGDTPEPSGVSSGAPSSCDALISDELLSAIGSVLLAEDRPRSTMGVDTFRRPDKLSRNDERLYGIFIPHLRRAFAIHRRLHQSRMHTNAGVDALNRVALGVILLDEQGKALLVNRSAQEILDKRDGLSLHADGLLAARQDAGRELHALIRNAAGRDGQNSRTGGAMALPRPSLQRPLSILVAPLRLTPRAFLQTDSVVIVFLSDPERGAETTLELLQRLYGLTPAEGRLAAFLLEGKTVEEAAGAQEIAAATARKQLKLVFRKTGVNRQSDLIRLLMSSLGQLRGS